MDESKLQGQPRISQVYLKQFGCKGNDEWWISIYEKENDCIKNVLIEKFTKETNIFDLPFDDDKLKRHFENQSSLVENHYRKIISNITNQKRLIKKDSTDRAGENMLRNYFFSR